MNCIGLPSLTRPTPERLQALAVRLASRPLNYHAGLLGRAADAPSLFADPRTGWIVDRSSASIGRGPDDFEAARAALSSWSQFAGEWTASMSPPAPIARGAVVTYSARVLGLWWSYGCRILEVVDEPTRFGFVYGTLAGHAERGEELFLIELGGDAGDERHERRGEHRARPGDEPGEDVVFSLFAMSRPGRWFSWPGLPIARRAQARFRATAVRSMRAAVAAACRPLGAPVEGAR